MKNVVGIGGIFLKCRDVEQTRAWYAKHLGIDMQSWGAQFDWKDETHEAPYSVLGLFKRSSEYFNPSDAPFMLNFRVRDLDALVAQLRADGIELIGEPVAEDYGKYAWIMDPEGNKIELWQQSA